MNALRYTMLVRPGYLVLCSLLGLVATSISCSNVPRTVSSAEDGGDWMSLTCPPATCPDSAHDCVCRSRADVMEVQIYRDRDEKPDRLDTYTYNQAGLLLTIERDERADGSIEVRQTFIHDENGIKRGQDTYSYDTHSRQSYYHDESGRLVQILSDDNADGVVDDLHRYTYDDEGHLATDTWENLGENGVVERVVYHYDRLGNLTGYVISKREKQVGLCQYDPPCASPYADCERTCEYN